jgi:flavin-dependent dehydrogenase
VRRASGEPLDWERVTTRARERQPALDLDLRHARRTGEWGGVGTLPYTSGLRESVCVFLAGDAAGVGDPFAGEGIGRALGAGPALFESFADGVDAPTARRRYYARLSAAYGMRFRLGGISRRLLAAPALFDVVSRAAFRIPRILPRFIAPFHHGVKTTRR